MNWNHLAEGRDILCVFVNTVMNCCVSNNPKKSLITEKMLASQDGLNSLESVEIWTCFMSEVVAECRRLNEGE
jgi:hypothetical protein